MSNHDKDEKDNNVQHTFGAGAHARALQALERRNRLRSLAPRHGIDFASNDYLGLANSPELIAAAQHALSRGVAVGSGGSRLLRGNTREHEALEEEAARFFGSEAALYFSSGFAANSTLLATLPQRGDLIIYDALIHASARDGIAASRAQSVEVPHNDVSAIEHAIKKWQSANATGCIWIAIETIYSMDGDQAPLDELVSLADRYNAMLLLDEAHATGIYGPDGRGLGAHLEGRENIVFLHTCGKALGAMGALVTGPKVLLDFMINRSRPFIYATAPSPLMAAIVRASLMLTKMDQGRREKLHELIVHTAKQLTTLNDIKITHSPIQPIIVGTDARALKLAQSLQQKGFDVRAVRPPTVPEGTARLRLTLTLNATTGDVDRLIANLKDKLVETAA
ncbi:MAG: 8-amino-7-oxononanoate synthase [Hyphomicrobiaceae bacterium]